MDLQSRKIEFIQEFLKIQNEDIVARLEMLLKTETSRVEGQEIKPFSIEEYHDRVDKSMLDAKNNRLTENKDLKSEIHKWH